MIQSCFAARTLLSYLACPNRTQCMSELQPICHRGVIAYIVFYTQTHLAQVLPLLHSKVPIALSNFEKIEQKLALRRSCSISDYLTPSHWQSYKAIKNRKLPESIPIAFSLFSPYRVQMYCEYEANPVRNAFVTT